MSSSWNTNTTALSVVIHPVAVSATYLFRGNTLGWVSNHAEADNAKGVTHYGAYVEEDRRQVLAAVISVGTTPYPNPTTVRPSNPRRMWALAVSPAFQGEGIGKTLVSHVTRIAHAEDVDVLWASVRDEALTFWEHIGFINDGTENISLNSGLPNVRVNKIL